MADARDVDTTRGDVSRHQDADMARAEALQRSGALAWGEAVDPADTLQALNGQALEVFGDVQVA